MKELATTLPPTSPSCPYTKVRSQLGTGDLIFLHSTSNAGVMIERLEQEAGLPPYSHLGMVIADRNALYLWDAPGGGECFDDPYEPDPDNRIHGTPSAHTGCRVSPLDAVLAYYRTRVDVPGFWVRQLTPPVAPDQFGALRRFINRVDGLPFTTGRDAGIAASFAFSRKGVSLFFGTYFCSQLVAESYMHMGLLRMDLLPSNGYSPAAFSMNDPARLPLVSPAKLSNVFFMEWDLPTGRGDPCPQ